MWSRKSVTSLTFIVLPKWGLFGNFSENCFCLVSATRSVYWVVLSYKMEVLIGSAAALNCCASPELSKIKPHCSLDGPLIFHSSLPFSSLLLFPPSFSFYSSPATLRLKDDVLGQSGVDRSCHSATVSLLRGPFKNLEETLSQDLKRHLQRLSKCVQLTVGSPAPLKRSRHMVSWSVYTSWDRVLDSTVELVLSQTLPWSQRF